MKVVIIGGVAGGATAAARIRRLDERAEIVMLERTGYVSYANCGLIEEESELTLQTPASFFARYRVDVRVLHEALSIDRGRREVLVKDLKTGQTYAEKYDKLLLSPGAKAVVPRGTHTEDGRVFTLRTVEDTFAIHRTSEEPEPEPQQVTVTVKDGDETVGTAQVTVGGEYTLPAEKPAELAATEAVFTVAAENRFTGPVLAPVLAVLEGAVWPQPASRPTLRAPASRRERAFFMSNAS